MSYLRKRQFNTSKELLDLSEKYLDGNETPSIEMYYKYIGISKQNYQDWKNSSTKKLNKWAEIIKEAKNEIHTYLAHTLIHGYSTSYLEATKLKKSTGKVKSFEFKRADKNSIKHYLHSRYKEDWSPEEVKITSSDDTSVTINFGNNGDNKIE